MDYIAQFRVMNPNQKPLSNRQRKPDYSAAFSEFIREVEIKDVFLNGVKELKWLRRVYVFEHFE